MIFKNPVKQLMFLKYYDLFTRRMLITNKAEKRKAVAASTLAGIFFQAEAGIRDHCVTGVQTCALPISLADVVEEGGDEQQIGTGHGWCRPPWRHPCPVPIFCSSPPSSTTSARATPATTPMSAST